MAGILLDSRKLMVYEDIKYLSEVTKKPSAFADRLWAGLLEDDLLYEEMLYFIDNKALKDKYSFKGYALTDLYVYMLSKSNLFNDTGKNTGECIKESMILDTFMGMIELKNNPDEYIKKLEAGDGMDKLF